MKPIIPEAALGQHIAALGKTGSGKTFGVKAAIVEPLLERGRRVGIVDPTGAWWGLRSSRDGKGTGFPILVLGGDHGDLPLPELGGVAVARLLVEQGVNLVADTSHLTVGKSARWFIDFAGTLYRLNKSPLHLVIDEAHNFAPQGKVPDPDTGKMLHAANRLASGGRSRGIRLVMITQRPQKLHKDTLTSADTLIAMRLLAPHDRAAVEEWIKGCGDPAQGKEVLNSLASLARGEGWVWYPEGGHLARSRFPDIKTFDSSATPTDGHSLEAPKRSADVDLAEIRRALADAVQEAEANDPKLLRAKNKKLEDENFALRKMHNEALKSASAARSDDVITAQARGRQEGWLSAVGKVQEVAKGLESWAELIQRPIHEFLEELGKLAKRFDGMALDAPGAAKPAQNIPQIIQPAPLPERSGMPPAPARSNGSGAGTAVLPKAERLILTALAQYPQGRTSVQVAVITGYAHGGGGFRNALGSLRTSGWMVGDSERLVITDAGRAALGHHEPLPRGRALLDHWFRQLSKAECKALEALAQAYPGTLTPAQVANRAGYEADGGGFRNALGRLRTLELIRGRGELRASQELFD